MALRSAARYEFGVKFVRFLPHNNDHTVATTDNVYSSVGPWDFSGADDISAVPLYTQVDDGDLITRLVDLSGVSDQTAVTADEIVSAIEVTEATGYSSYDVRVTSTGDTRVTSTGDTRILADPLVTFTATDGQIFVTASSAVHWIQVFGELAEICLFGQGSGLRWITCDTVEQINQNRRNVGSDTHAIRDGAGEVTEMRGHPRHGGRKITMTDTATDYSLITLVDDPGRSFLMEIYTPSYEAGHSPEAHPVAYVQEQLYNCVGRSTGPNRSRDIATRQYEFQATKGAGYSVDYAKTALTPAEYSALGLAEY